jgi:hypothetical protein
MLRLHHGSSREIYLLMGIESTGAIAIGHQNDGFCGDRQKNLIGDLCTALASANEVAMMTARSPAKEKSTVAEVERRMNANKDDDWAWLGVYLYRRDVTYTRAVWIKGPAELEKMLPKIRGHVKKRLEVSITNSEDEMLFHATKAQTQQSCHQPPSGKQ